MTAPDNVDTLRVFPEQWLYPLALADAFPRPGPIEVDVGCGKGRFLLARAARHPGTNFLGIDRMLRRIRKVDNKARRLGLAHVRLLRVEAYYAVTHLMPPDSVSVYYIFFPDPWPKKRHQAHRLFNPAFIRALHRTLVSGGAVQVATDHIPYFEQIEQDIRASGLFEAAEAYVPDKDEQTDFERYYAQHGPIGRCGFVKPPA